ncbi:U3 small nucleolar RNA-associated protein 13 [Trichomonascus vanleenenianus]|uniref:U3 snoRNA-associated protein UTP13 n=1 Tax=Trichomonascus vanleenenianus TaxID=2268995 RepID=UPI003ECAE6CB
MSLKTSFKSRSVEPFYNGGGVSLSGDGKTLATSFNDEVVITDLESGEQIAKIEGDGERVTALQLSPDGKYLVVCSSSLLMRILELQEDGKYKTTKSVKAHESPVLMATIDPTSTLVATGGAEGAVKVWDLKGGFVTHNFRGHARLISALKFYGVSGTRDWRLASGSDDNTVRVWDLVKSKCVAVLDSHVSMVRGLDFTSDGKYLISGGRDRVVSVWSTASKKLVNTIPVMEVLETVGFLTDDVIYTGGQDGVIKLWSRESGEKLGEQALEAEVAETEEEEISIVDIIHDKSSGTLFSVLNDQTILQLDSDLALKRRISGMHGEIIDCCFVSGDRLAIATNSPRVRIVSLDNMLDFEELAGHENIVIAIDRSIDGNWLATAGKDKLVKLWNLEGTPLSPNSYATFRGHTAAIGAVALPRAPPKSEKSTLPDFIISGAQDRTVKRWDVKTGSDVYTKIAHEKDINAIDISPDNKYFATASQDRTVKIWDIDTGEVVGILRGHKRGVWSVRFNPYDKMIVTASGDKTIKLWSLNDYTCVRTFEGHSNSVLKVGWISQGQQIVSAGGDGLVKVWDAKTGECNATLDNHEDKVWSLAMKEHSDDEFVSGGGDSVITVWSDITEEVQQEAEERQAHQVEQEQKLDNLVRNKDWKNAILVAMELDQPFKLYNLFKELIQEGEQEVVAVMKLIELDRIKRLLERVRDWNTTARTSEVAQSVLRAILEAHPIDEILKLPGIMKLIEALRPYSERHYNRLDDLLQESFSLDYILNEMEVLL